WRIVRPARRVARGGIEQAADHAAWVALEFRLGDARLLEIELIELRGLRLRHGARRPPRPARPKRHTEARDPPESVRPQQCGVPGDRSAPVMADDRGPLLPERVDDADHVADEVQERIFLDLFRPIRLAIAAHVRRDRMVAGFRERLQLPSPGIPGFGKAVAEDDERAFARLGEMDADSIRLDRPMCDLGHLRFSPGGLPTLRTRSVTRNPARCNSGRSPSSTPPGP